MARSLSGLPWILLLLLAPGAARANDTAIDYSGGQITFKKAEGIIMEDELLTISSKRVTVAYVFRNTTNRDVEIEVGFPIRVAYGIERADEDGAEPLPSREWRATKRNTSDFQVLVEGKRQSFQSLERWSDQEYELVHLWRQRFPAGATVRISHQYRASPDGMSVSAGTSEDWQKLGYCVGPKLAAVLGRDTHPFTRVRYVLTTGANWSGPIRHFRLVLERIKPRQRISLCLDGLERTSPTTFQLDRKDFTPTEDLNVVFIE
jgi:hypothetical protein